MGRISEEVIQQIVAASDIVDVVGSYLPLSRAGSAFRALCPFHKEKTPSFNVNPQRQSFHCFGCGAGGGVIRFVMDYESLPFLEAVRKLAQRAGIRVVEESGPEETDARDRRDALKALHAMAADWFHRQLFHHPTSSVARDYLKSRGLTREVVVSWRIGFAPESWDDFLKHAHAKRCAEEDLMLSGLVKPRGEENPGAGLYDRFRYRIMFPIRNESGEVIAFSGRTLSSDSRVPKYLNSPETPIFTKGRVLFGLDKSRRAILSARSAVVLEGQLDLITCYEAGIENVVAPQGTAFTLEQAHLLRRYCDEAVLCFDSVTAGQNAAEKSFTPLIEAGLGVRVARMPAGEDPDSLVRSRGGEAFSELIAAAPEFAVHLARRLGELHDLKTTRGQLAAADQAAKLFAAAKDPVLRESLVLRTAPALGISREALATRMRGVSRATQRETEGEVRPTKPRFSRPGESIHLLCLAAIHSEEARKELLSRDWRSPLGKLPDGEPLLKLLESSGAGATDVAALTSVFESRGESELAAYFHSLTQLPAPSNAAPVAARWWDELVLRTEISERSSRIENIAASGHPDFANISLLRKEILDLRERLKKLPPVPVAGG